jgi:hypothetical protein
MGGPRSAAPGEFTGFSAPAPRRESFAAGWAADTMHGMSAFPQPEAARPVFSSEPGPAAAASGARQEGAAVPEPRDAAEDAAAGAPPEQPDPAARAAAAEASILAAFGGKRGLAETGLPSIVFIGVYTATTSLNPSLWSAVAVAAVLTVLRLVQKDTLQHAFGGLIGVAVCAAFAKYTGQAKNFYLPGVLLNAGEAVLFSVSALVRWPIVGVVIGPITGEMTAWRAHPERLRAFTVSTWLLAAMFTFRVLIEVPLYLGNEITALGAAKVVLGYPLYLAVAFVCWRIIKRAPLPVQG